ncbi:DoxX family protein [Hymenobacter koreensis]|uniref:DoxX family protein n=1 Tax=Hymenobacter koreensis TaxID=1084523 RepID=A0ABP8JNP8_9BACT
MKSQPTTALYWITTLVFSAFMLMSGVTNFLETSESQEVMKQLGYPMHVLRVIGLGKTLGALALLQTRFRTLKEWAYAGFTFDLIGAAVAWGDTTGEAMAVVFPLLFLAFMAVNYLLWKKMERLRAYRAAGAPAEQPLAAELAV